VKFIPLLIFGWLVLNASPALAQSDAQIQIVSPRDGGIVAIGDVTVTVATKNFILGDTNHWHLYVDGELRSMVGNGAPSWTTKIETSGPHEIKATLADAQHEELAAATIHVTAAPATPTESPFNLSQTAPVIGVLALLIIVSIVVALRLKPRQVTSER
jgi:hypothetical protein